MRCPVILPSGRTAMTPERSGSRHTSILKMSSGPIRYLFGSTGRPTLLSGGLIADGCCGVAGFEAGGCGGGGCWACARQIVRAHSRQLLTRKRTFTFGMLLCVSHKNVLLLYTECHRL